MADTIESLLELGIAEDRDEAEAILGDREIIRQAQEGTDEEEVVDSEDDNGFVLEEEETQKTLGEMNMSDEKDFMNDEYPSMNEGGEKKVPEEFRNTLDTANVERREKIIEERVDALRGEAFQSGAASAYEVDDMAEALRNELEGEMIDTLFGYKPDSRGTDYQRLKGRVDEKLGRSIKTASGETEEEKLNREYPSMSTDPRREYRKALGLGAK